MQHTPPRPVPASGPVPPRRRRLRGVTVTAAALLDPPTYLDDAFEMLRHADVFRLLRERGRGASAPRVS